MSNSPSGVSFTLEDIFASAIRILEANPQELIKYRLLKEVLRCSTDAPELVHTKKAAAQSKWVHQLESEQLPDGSWGRFHSQDTKIKAVFRTTEAAIDRSFALGLDGTDPVLIKTRQFILDVLHGDAKITDRDEKSASWPLLIRFILAGRLAQIDSANQELDSFWTYLLDVARQSFSSANYRLQDEIAAYNRLSSIHVPLGFLESQHTLWILSSRQLPEELEQAVLNWIWNKPDGIRYIRVPLAEPKPSQIGYWLRSMNIITRFKFWRDVSTNTLNRLWEQRNVDGLWDFGSSIARCVEFPISDSWRQVRNRRMDYSAHILSLLRKYFD